MFASGAARNQGIEALATLPDGVLLAVGEGATGDEGRTPAALRSRSGTVRVGFASGGGLHPTDAVAVGPWLLILERRLSLLTGWHSRIVAVPIDRLATEPRWRRRGRELALSRDRELGENYEGLAATPDGAGAVGWWS